MWEMLGFECDEIGYRDTIPLDRSHFGINYRHHSQTQVENNEENSAEFAIPNPSDGFDISGQVLEQIETFNDPTNNILVWTMPDPLFNPLKVYTIRHHSGYFHYIHL